MNTTSKILTAAIVVPSIMTLGLVNVSANTTSSPTDAQLNQSFEESIAGLSFSDMKEAIITELKAELEYTPDAVKNQITASLKVLEPINSEDDFFSALDTEDAKISALYDNEEETSEPQSFDDFKASLIKNAEAELKTITDATLKKEVEQEIKDLKAIKNETELDALFDRYFAEALGNQSDDK